MMPEEAITERQPSGSIRVGLYLRVSTREQAAEGGSLQVQKELAAQYAEPLHGPDVRAESVSYYADIGRSGMDADRPELNRLLADVHAGHRDPVVADLADRVSRTRLGHADFDGALNKHGVRLRFVNDRPQTALAGSD